MAGLDIFILSFACLNIITTVSDQSEEFYDSNDKITQIERDALAIEIYLQDRKDHKKYCSKLKWDQPKISVYKEKLISQLPIKCKK